MTTSSIPVDLLNPGQVFACLGFLEAANTLLGNAEGGFDWSDESNVRFHLQANGEENPFAVVLKFLTTAEIERLAHIGYEDKSPNKKKKKNKDNNSNTDASIVETKLKLFETYPDNEALRMSLPIHLTSELNCSVVISHWADGSSRNAFKLYAGNRSAQKIASAMLNGTYKKPTKKKSNVEIKTLGITHLWNQKSAQLINSPFDVLTNLGGSFNFDPRGAWTTIDAGYSPDEHHHGIASSPVVELLAALGLEHARPDEYEKASSKSKKKRKVRYWVWSGLLPPILARITFSGAPIVASTRRFHFILDLSGKNKVITFAEKEI